MAIVDSWALTSQMSTNYMYVYERLTIIRVFREIVYFVRIFKTNRFFLSTSSLFFPFQLLNIFGLVWSLLFISAIVRTTLATTVTRWYWKNQKNLTIDSLVFGIACIIRLIGHRNLLLYVFTR